MPNDYKICNSCGEKVDVNANFCPSCKSQSFRTKAVIVRGSDEPVSLKHKLFYWNYDGEFVLSKSKLSAISIFLIFFISGLNTTIPAGYFTVSLIISAIIFLLGYLIHIIRGRPKDAVIHYNDYGLGTDIFHLFFFWQNKKTGEFVPSKTKIISFAIFIVFAILSLYRLSIYTLGSIVLFAVFFETPAFLIGYGIHKLTNPYPTNPKRIPPKEPKKMPKKEEPKAVKTATKQPPEPEVIPKFVMYENKIEDLKAEYDAKEKVARDLIEKRFTPPQITYTRFISVVDKATEVFNSEYSSAINILHLASEESPRIDSEIESKIAVLNSIIDKIEDLTNELVLSMDTSKDEDAKNLIDDMENLISSVKDYDDS